MSRGDQRSREPDRVNHDTWTSTRPTRPNRADTKARPVRDGAERPTSRPEAALPLSAELNSHVALRLATQSAMSTVLVAGVRPLHPPRPATVEGSGRVPALKWGR
jgi:hypothetical protein